jgi:O-succinylbenzoic acid--CoA ligase
VSATQDPVRFWARMRPARVALRTATRTWSYGELDAAVQEAAESLYAQGLDAGQHISVEFDPTHGFQFAITLHALHRAGLLPALVGAALTPEERRVLRGRALADLTLASSSIDPEERDALGAGVRGGGGPDGPGESSRTHPRGRVNASGLAPIERRLESPAAICFTSGTTGESRAVALTHGNLLWSALASARNLGVREDDVWLCVLPLHHVAGLSILTRSAFYGTAAMLLERFDANAVSDAIDHMGVTLVSLVPPMLERLLDARGDRPFPPAFRAALIGGGSVPGALLERAAALRLRALPTYGTTETCSQVVTLSPHEWPGGLATAGRPLPFAHVAIRGPGGGTLGREEEGEICVRGPMVAEGYLGDPAATAAAFDGRWFRTGDVGAWDAEGRLAVLDRRDDRIVVGGENVSPAEVERVLREDPAVADACVVGLPSGAWGHEVAAAIVLRLGATATPEEIVRRAATSLARFKLPRRAALVDALPRSASGKLLRRVVRDRFLDQVALKEGP